jgi:hypothetical protein
MPKMTADVKSAHSLLFNNCYYMCRALRAIIAYVDGELPRPQWHNNPQISRQLFVAIASEEFHEELVTWRNIFADTWQHLQDTGRIVNAVEQQHSRSIGELARTYDTASGMIRSLESRLFEVLLTSRLQTTMQ